MKKNQKPLLIEKSSYTLDCGIEVSFLKSSLAICMADWIVVNGVKGFLSDFGDTIDQKEDLAPPFGCGNRVFISREYCYMIEKKYGLTKSQYKELISLLSEKFGLGRCNYCAEK